MKLKPLNIIVVLLLLCLLLLGYFVQARSAKQARQQLESDMAALETRNSNLVIKQATTEAELYESLQKLDTVQAAATLTTQSGDTGVSEANVAFANQIATDVLIQLDKHYDLAVLLAVEAFHIADTSTTRSTLLYALQHNLQLKTILPNENWGSAESVAFSPDGSLLAVSHSGGQVTLYDLSAEPYHAQSLIGLIELGGEDTGPTNVAFSPDGQLVAATHGVNTHVVNAQGYQTVVWDINTYEIVSTGQEEFLQKIVFLSDGKHLISLSVESIVSWEVIPGHELKEVSRYALPTEAWWNGVLAVHPKENTVAFSYEDGRVDILNPFTGEITDSFVPASTAQIRGLAYNPNGSFLAINTQDELILWDTIQKQVIGEPIVALPLAAEFSEDGQSLLFANPDESFGLLDVETLESQGTSLQHWGNSRLLNDIDLHPNGHFIASGYKTGEVMLWDMLASPRIGTTLATSNAPDSFISETILATVSTNGALEFWDVLSGQVLTKTSGFPDPDLRDVVFNDAYTIAATHVFTNHVSTISLIDPLSNYLISSPITQTAFVTSLALSPQGSILATGDKEGVLQLGDTSTGLMINDPVPGHNRAILTVEFSPDGRVIASGGYYEIFLRDVESQQPLFRAISAEADDLVFHPNGSMFVSISNGSFPAYVWDSTNGNFLGEVLSEEELAQFTFSPNSQMMASTHWEHIDFGRALPFMVFWDGKSTQQIGPNLEYYWNPVFNPSGTFLASTYRYPDENEVFVWNLDTDFWIEQACRTVNRNLTEKEWSLYFRDKPYRETCLISQ